MSFMPLCPPNWTIAILFFVVYWLTNLRNYKCTESKVQLQQLKSYVYPYPYKPFTHYYCRPLPCHCLFRRECHIFIHSVSILHTHIIMYSTTLYHSDHFMWSFKPYHDGEGLNHGGCWLSC